MRIVSWNVNRNVYCVDYAFDYLGADVVMTQEGKMSDYPEVHAVGSDVDERWTKRRWGNYTFSKHPVQALEFPTEYRGSLHGVSLDSSIGQILLFNIYGLFEPVEPGSRKKIATPGVHRKLSDISPVLWKKLDLNHEHVLIAGDLNHDRKMDRHKSFRRPNSEVFDGVFSRFEDFGLVDLLNRDYPDGVSTFEAVRGGASWQLDHAFASRALAGRASTWVDDSSETRPLSDHRPVVMDIDI